MTTSAPVCCRIADKCPVHRTLERANRIENLCWPNRLSALRRRRAPENGDGRGPGRARLDFTTFPDC